MIEAHELESLPKIPGARIVILQASWHREYTDKMLEKCLYVLNLAEAPEPEIYRVPGSMELPVTAQTVIRAKKGAIDCLICFGAILKGDTFHFEVVMNECSRGLTEVSLKENIPIINEVIPATSLNQIVARCSDDVYNKGYEAGKATVEMIQLRRQIVLNMKP